MRPDAGFTWTARRLRSAAALVAACLTLAGMPGVAAGSEYDPGLDPYASSSIVRAIGATAWWTAGYTGAGIDVAVIDSGVSPVEGLDSPGKIVYGPDLSLESQAPDLAYLDTFGHGTFMAGLIAGRDGTITGGPAGADSSAYVGVAPDARIVSIKVATADGGTDVTQVIAAINWVIEHRRSGDLNIRVLNLSYGTNSTQASGIDPLSYAVERAWRQGIVVVASAGNTGYQRAKGAPGLANPAYNPFVIGVGGIDNRGTADWHDDIVAAYSASSNGTKGAKNPDFVTVGSHLQGLRVGNSWIDAMHPEGRLGSRFFRGSGTSEAAAITSGAIALLLQKFPTLSPDRLKRFIKDNAQKVASFDSQAQGAGELNLKAMLPKVPPLYVQKFPAATGLGTIEGARGQDHLSRDGVVLTGERDIFGAAIDSSTLASQEASGDTWDGGAWNGNRWAGDAWAGNRWSGDSWAGNAWDGRSWSGNTWASNSWSGNRWSGDSWAGSSWSGTTWSGNSWATAGWR
jgi:hypothetical protein